jgi:hypothetical protein
MAAAALDAEAGATNGSGGVSHAAAKPGPTAGADAGAAFVLESKGTHAHATLPDLVRDRVSCGAG